MVVGQWAAGGGLRLARGVPGQASIGGRVASSVPQPKLRPRPGERMGLVLQVLAWAAAAAVGVGGH
eukprot:1139595-Pelagomonas_calceolata.AAC.2